MPVKLQHMSDLCVTHNIDTMEMIKN